MPGQHKWAEHKLMMQSTWVMIAWLCMWCSHQADLYSKRSTVDLPLPLVPTIAQLVPAGT